MEPQMIDTLVQTGALGVFAYLMVFFLGKKLDAVKDEVQKMNGKIAVLLDRNPRED